MGLISQTVNGSILAVAGCYAFHSLMINRTALISSQLQILAKDLDASTLRSSDIPPSPSSSSSEPRPEASGQDSDHHRHVPYVPLSTRIKAGWNDAVQHGIATVERADWAAVGRDAFEGGKRTWGRVFGDGGASPSAPAERIA